MTLKPALLSLESNSAFPLAGFQPLVLTVLSLPSHPKVCAYVVFSTLATILSLFSSKELLLSLQIFAQSLLPPSGKTS